MRINVIFFLCFCLIGSSGCQQAEVERLNAELELAHTEIAKLTREAEEAGERADKLVVENEELGEEVKENEAALAELRSDFREQLEKDEAKFSMLREAYNDLRTADETEYAHLADLIRKEEWEKAVARQRELAVQRQAELKSNIESGNVTLDQIKPHLMNKTPEQVRELLGSPSSTYTGNKWRYSDQVYNPYVGAKTSLRIQFENGVVSEVGYWGQQ